MGLIKVSKNCYRGIEITNYPYIVQLAKHRKSVIIEIKNFRKVIPAAFIQNWSVKQCSKFKIYTVIKSNKHE